MRLIMLLFCVCPSLLLAQYSKGDSLRGSLNSNRNWWDVLRYRLNVKLDIDNRFISGSNIIVFKKKTAGDKMQIDLQSPLIIDSVRFHNSLCKWTHNYNAWLISLPSPANDTDSILVFYSGKPRPAKFPPWDGGISWKKDEKGRPWIAVSCQGLGASVWWPNKDHQDDEPDQGMTISVTVPDTLINISNGRLRSSQRNSDSTATFIYEVKNPINNYDVTFNTGKYITVKDSFMGLNGKLGIEYAVLDYNKEKIESHLKKDTHRMLECFEFWFGPFPFYEDGYRLVETPYLGMEHQSAIAYGNKFRKGYMGMDRSRTGVGMLWDFIIVHESGHEWFGNNITCKDNADMWIHESFTTYSEVLFMQCAHSKDTAEKYLLGLRRNIMNDKNMIGDYGVNREGSNDIYDKGANMIHTIRQIINDDTLFRKILIGMNAEFGKKTVTTTDIEHYWIQKSGKNLKPVFNQYLRSTTIPVINLSLKNNKLTYYFSNCLPEFTMPVRLFTGEGKALWVTPTINKQKVTLGENVKSVRVDENFYLKVPARK